MVGVTILTSLDNKALKKIGFNNEIKKIVLAQAKLARKARLDAIVCSAQEVDIVKKIFKKDTSKAFTNSIKMFKTYLLLLKPSD